MGDKSDQKRFQTSTVFHKKHYTSFGEHKCQLKCIWLDMQSFSYNKCNWFTSSLALLLPQDACVMLGNYGKTRNLA